MAPKTGIKDRLDILLVARGLAESREQAKRLILAGLVKVEGVSNPKPGQLVDAAVTIVLSERERYVSRGGLKLEEALRIFDISLEGRVCADIGASTGGFTDCMLQHGAARVYAVDVGATQMHERIRHDTRVVLLQHTNARELRRDLFQTAPTFAAVDVSFISIRKIAPALRSVLAQNGEAVLLIKPQFEAGREAVNKGKGVIRDEAVHRDVLSDVLAELESDGWEIRGLGVSPITGGSGNIEFLCHVGASGSGLSSWKGRIAIDEVIQCARAKFK